MFLTFTRPPFVNTFDLVMGACTIYCVKYCSDVHSVIFCHSLLDTVYNYSAELHAGAVDVLCTLLASMCRRRCIVCAGDVKKNK